MLSRPSVVAGEAIVELNNQGEDPHNLNLRTGRRGGRRWKISEAGPWSTAPPASTSPPATTGSGAASPNTRKKG